MSQTPAPFLASDQIVKNFDGLTTTVRRGTVAPQSNTVSVENPVWEQFARSMVPLMAMPAQAIADILGGAVSGPQRVLDIASGFHDVARHDLPGPETVIVATR